MTSVSPVITVIFTRDAKRTQTFCGLTVTSLVMNIAINFALKSFAQIPIAYLGDY